MRALICAAAVALALTGCGRRRRRTYDTKVAALKSVEVVSRDAAGQPLIVEVNVEYPPTDCPGEQLETLQGNVDFTKCAIKYKSGDVLPTTVEWSPTDYGHYDSEIHLEARRLPSQARSARRALPTRSCRCARTWW